MKGKVIIIATTNPGKVKEVKEILEDIFPDTEFKSLKEVNCTYDVIEDATTFEGNAIKKAREYSKMLNLPCIADDSGLCIDIYDGWPGVITARFLGENKTPDERNKYILEKMKDLTNKEDRKAKHITSIAFAYDDEIIVTTGVNEGFISDREKGDNGFGFDKIFELPNGLTQAELSSIEKNKISARKKALTKLRELILNS
jgi:XTP/dITP diphosphohydrolase